MGRALWLPFVASAAAYTTHHPHTMGLERLGKCDRDRFLDINKGTDLHTFRRVKSVTDARRLCQHLGGKRGGKSGDCRTYWFVVQGKYDYEAVKTALVLNESEFRGRPLKVSCTLVTGLPLTDARCDSMGGTKECI